MSLVKKKKSKPQRYQRRSYIIFTEGETEQGYFKQFKVRCKTIGGGNALKIVEEAIVQKINLKNIYDEYWVVFDKDAITKSDFIKAVDLAAKNNIKAAYSCDAFEIWWLFHFREIISRIDSNQYEKEIKRYIPSYSSRNKGEEQGRNMWLILYHKLECGINNAHSAHKIHSNLDNAYSQSITTVYQLVEQLLDEGR